MRSEIKIEVVEPTGEVSVVKEKYFSLTESDHDAALVRAYNDTPNFCQLQEDAIATANHHASHLKIALSKAGALMSEALNSHGIFFLDNEQYPNHFEALYTATLRALKATSSPLPTFEVSE